MALSVCKFGAREDGPTKRVRVSERMLMRVSALAAHLSHSTEDSTAAYVPASQSTHACVDADALYLPAGHAVQWEPSKRPAAVAAKPKPRQPAPVVKTFYIREHIL